MTVIASLSRQLDQELKGFGIRVLRTSVRAPKANAYCERLVGTLRRECLDYLIPLNENHLKWILREYITHYNQGRPHSALGPGIPEPPRLDPYCGVASVATCLRNLGLPWDIKSVSRICRMTGVSRPA